jgi:hypothetical protein
MMLERGAHSNWAKNAWRLANGGKSMEERFVERLRPLPHGRSRVEEATAGSMDNSGKCVMRKVPFVIAV